MEYTFILKKKYLTKIIILLIFQTFLFTSIINAADLNPPENLGFASGDIITYTLTVTSGSGDGEYQAGEEVQIAADEPDVGQVFAGWSGDVDYVDNSSSSSTTLTMPEGDIQVTANYEDKYFSVTVTWEDDQEPAPEGYYVYVGTQSGDYDRKIDAGLVSSTTINDLEKGETYYITVTAYDMFGHESSFGEEVEIDASQD